MVVSNYDDQQAFSYVCFHKIFLRRHQCGDQVHSKVVVDSHSQEAKNEYSIK